MEVEIGCKNTCRVCLEEGAHLSLFDDVEEIKLFLKIMACSTVQICEEDGYPSKICPLCHTMLNTAFEFKQICETSDYKLRNCITKDAVKIEHLDVVFPEDDVFASYHSDDDLKNFDDSDDVKLFHSIKIKEEVKVRKKRSGKKKKKWKSSEKKSLLIVKKEKLEKSSSRPSKLVKSGLSSSRKKIVSNRIATSLLEGMCLWNGKDWRFDADQVEIDKAKKELEELPKLLKENEELVRAKKVRKKSKVKTEKALTVNLCDTCGKTFKSKYHLKYHIMLKHQEMKGNIKCKDPDCKKMFKLDHYMQRHVKRCHSARREFICNECGKQYAFISGLKQHMKSHSGTQVWKHCSFCTQKYRTQKSVDIHIRSVHTGERPSVCTMCDSAFFHDDYLKEHMRLHTGETPYKCPICKRGYAQRGNMKSHMKQHRMSELDDTMKATMKPNYLKLLRDC